MFALLSDLLAAVRRHPIVTGVLAVLALAYGFVSFWIGFVQMVVLLVPVALLAGWLLKRRHDRGGSEGRAEAIAAIAYVALASVLVFTVIQAIPYGRSEVRSTGTAGEPQWDSQATRDMVVNACYDCHSNDIEYPAYSKIAPISWMVASHVGEGREKLNFSTWTTNKHGFDDMIETIRDRSMPPSYFTHFGRHPEAKLSDAEIEQLVAGLKATFGSSLNDGHGEGGEGDGDD